MNDAIDAGGLRRHIRGKYRDVALRPGRAFGFRTGRPLAEFLGYPRTVIDALPGRAVESFAGVGNPFALRPLRPGPATACDGPTPGAAHWRQRAGRGPRAEAADLTPVRGALLAVRTRSRCRTRRGRP